MTELDGVGDRQGIFVVAATNRPDMIDSAMLRPGRLDKQLMVELPSPEERVAILKQLQGLHRFPLKLILHRLLMMKGAEILVVQIFQP